MNKGIAHILMSNLITLPFINKFGGMVYTVDKSDAFIDQEAQTSNRVVKLIPATEDYHINGTLAQSCKQPTDFVPDASYTGLLYFEDNGGTDPLGREGHFWKYKSKLRLVAWINSEKIVQISDSQPLPGYSVTLPLIAAIQERLNLLDLKAVGYYNRLKVKEAKISSQDKSIFSSYTYDHFATQYVMPPYEYFAIDYEVEFRIHPNCIDKLTIEDLGESGIICNEDDESSMVETGCCSGLAYQTGRAPKPKTINQLELFSGDDRSGYNVMIQKEGEKVAKRFPLSALNNLTRNIIVLRIGVDHPPANIVKHPDLKGRRIAYIRMGSVDVVDGYTHDYEDPENDELDMTQLGGAEDELLLIIHLD